MRGFAALMVVATALALPARPVLALACEEYDIRQAFWRHADSVETYTLVYGSFSKLRRPHHDKAADTVTWRATFNGLSASDKAFDQLFISEVVITHHLFSLIDGGGGNPLAMGEGLPGVKGLVFLRKTSTGHALDTELCVPVVDTERAHLRQALDCMNFRRCARPE